MVEVLTAIGHVDRTEIRHLLQLVKNAYELLHTAGIYRWAVKRTNRLVRELFASWSSEDAVSKETDGRHKVCLHIRP